MNNPNQILDQDVIDLMTGEQFSSLLPLPYFQNFAKKYGKDLRDKQKFYRPLYPTFCDFNYRHDTSILKPVYLNDFDFVLEEDRQAISDLIRLDFDSDTFDTIAKCLCGNLRGNYLLGTNRTCRICGEKVERLVDATLNTKVWLRRPEGVAKFINPGFYRTFFASIGTSSPKIRIVEAIINPTYRRNESIAKKENGKRLIHELKKIGMELNYNSFVNNCDLFMEHFMLGEGRKLTNMSMKNSEEMYRLYHKHRHLVFSDYLPVPNRFATVIERNGSNKYVYANQLKVSNVYQSIADTRDTTEIYRVTAEDIKSNIDIVGKSIVALAEFNSTNLKDLVFRKSSTIRKHVISGSLPMSGRSIIISRTGIHDPGVAKIPRIMMMAMLKIQLTSVLYRKGYPPTKVHALIAEASTRVVPEVDEIILDWQRKREIVGILGRNPTIQYLSVRCFFLEMNEDIDDESINLPILSVKPFNAKYIK